MNLKDKQLTCKDCQKPFVFTISEQKYYAEMKYQSPSRCSDCRKKRRQARPNKKGNSSRQKGRRQSESFRQVGSPNLFGAFTSTS